MTLTEMDLVRGAIAQGIGGQAMITSNWDWSLFALEQDGFCPDVTVDAPRHERISAILGPDGEPLKVGYARPRLGFDLTPRGKRT